MRFRTETEKTVVLECVDCKGWHDYPPKEFRKAHLRTYLKQGYIFQHCSCRGKSRDEVGNTRHKVVGWFKAEQKRLTPGGVSRFLKA